jgi:hypothetical protein
VLRVVILKRVRVVKNLGRLAEADPVLAEVSRRLRVVPLESDSIERSLS